MKWFKAATMAGLLISAVLGVNAAKADDDIYVGWASTEEVTELKDLGNFRCTAFASCPANTIYVDSSNNWVGCTPAGGLGCFGTCIKCSGSATPARICKFKAGETCAPTSTPGNIALCGFEIEGECSISGTWLGPNGCGCKFTTTTPTTFSCSFFNCV